MTLLLLGLLYWPSRQRPVATAVAGDRVRIATNQGIWTTGVVRVAGADSLIIETTTGNALVRLDNIATQRAQVSRGRATRTRRGMRIGLVAGAVLGTSAGLLLESSVCDVDCSFGSRGDGAALAGVLTALAGLGIGALIGSAAHHELWADLRLDIPTVSLTVPSGGVGLTLRWALPPVR
ncbi:MAG: hypothetical protein V4503_05395 [Gemmatimonadota bacterium]